jgi:hypothetical protein
LETTARRLSALVAAIGIGIMPLLAAPPLTFAAPAATSVGAAAPHAAPTDAIHLRIEAARTNSSFCDPSGTVALDDPVTDDLSEAIGLQLPTGRN